MTSTGRLLPLVVASALLTVLAFALLPFRAAGALECGPALRGSKPERDVTVGLLVGRERPVCQARGNSRLIAAGLAGVVLLVVGVGAVLLPESEMERAVFGEEGDLPDYGP
ncbi:MAG: hypothetical protein M3N68_09860 [Actinomycetota bacterium]|nr:hypothetical protein [Actinomycetota bacterium]